MRLFYLGIIKDLKSTLESKEGGDEKNGKENKAVEGEELVNMQKSLKGKLEESQKQCSQLQNELNAVKRDLMIMRQAKCISDKSHIIELTRLHCIPNVCPSRETLGLLKLLSKCKVKVKV